MVVEFTVDARKIADGFRFAESPHWHDGLLWFSDMHADKVYAIDDVGTIRTTVDVPGGPNGLGWLPDGRMLVVSTSRRLIYRLDQGHLVVHADLSKLGDCAHPLNDMCVGPDGSCYVGEFGLDIYAWMSEHIPKIKDNDMTVLRHLPAAGASLFHVSPDGAVQQAVSDLRFPNGVTITDDNMLVVAESLGLCVSIFKIGEHRLLNPKKIYCDFGPDGLSQPDCEGRIWVADPIGKSVSLLSPEGEWLLRGYAPRSIYACAIRKDKPNTVYLCTSSSADPDETAKLRDSSIEVLDVTACLKLTK